MLDEDKIKTAFKEAGKTKVPDTWEQVSRRVNAGEVVQRKSKRSIVRLMIRYGAARLITRRSPGGPTCPTQDI